jgi:hypothetical protein
MQIARLVEISRAVSWVESKHGTYTGGTQPKRDPMQCGNPADAWWKELTGQTTKKSRFVGGKNASNYNSDELPAAAEADGRFPANARVSSLGDKKQGHNDGAFNAVLSYYWGVVWLLHRCNTPPIVNGGKMYSCGDLNRDRLIGGAVNYNGGGDPDYKTKIVDALRLFNGLP